MPLIAYYKFDEGSGTTTADSSGNAHTGNFVGSPTWQTGYTGSGIHPVSGGYISVSDAADLRITGDLTITGWVNLTDLSNFSYFAVKSDNGVSHEFVFRIDKTTGILTIQRGDGSSQGGQSSTGAVATGAWKHIAVSVSGQTASFYINGAFDSSGNGLTVAPTSSTNNLSLGTQINNTTNFVNGILDEIRIYNEALNASQILSIYTGVSGGRQIATGRILASSRRPAVSRQIASGRKTVN